MLLSSSTVCNPDFFTCNSILVEITFGHESFWPGLLCPYRSFAPILMIIYNQSMKKEIN